MIHEIQKEETYRNAFPFKENPSAWMFLIAAHLTEEQGRRVTVHITSKGVNLRDYTRELLKDVIVDLLLQPKNSLEDPSQRSRGGKGFSGPLSSCILEDVEDIVTEVPVYWVEEEEFSFRGFLYIEEEDPGEFWFFDFSAEDQSQHAWKVWRSKGRHLRRGDPRRGGEGKGEGGRRRCRRRRREGKGRSHLAEDDAA